jgi:hypothetical protein
MPGYSTDKDGNVVYMQVDGVPITLAASAARTASDNGVAVLVSQFRRFAIVCAITVSTHESGDTLDVYVDVSLDGSTWYNAVHFTQQAGNGEAVSYFAILDTASPGTAVVDVTSNAASGAVRPTVFGAYMRARWALVDSGDKDTSHTFSVIAYGQ